MRCNILLLFAAMISLVSIPAFGQKHALSTAQITAEIQDKLYHAHVPQHGQVQVAFDNGVATLTGTVDSVGVKMDAERAARKVEDVTQIADNITVNTEDVTDRQIVEEARKEIVTYYAYSIFDWITLEASGHTLTVNGEVSQPFKKEDIGNFLAHIKGVANLQNNLEVLPTSQFDDSLRIAIARAIYNDPYFIHYATQALPPIHIIVQNGNVTLEGVVANEVDRAKAESDARFAGTFFNLTNNLRVEKGQAQ
jgi:hyperosmotically inducible periplasmic protein